jgi:hypothetical protein
MRQLLLIAVGGAVLAVAVATAAFLMYREESLPMVVDGKATTFPDMAPEVLDLIADRDAVAFKRLVVQTMRLHRRIEEQAALFSKRADEGLSADERQEALSLFEAVLDHTVALDHLARFHLDFWHVDVVNDGARHARHFALFFASYVEKLAIGLALIDRTINKPQFEKLFDEGNHGLGIAPGAYQRLKWNVVHVEDASTALAAHQWMKILSGTLDELSQQDPQTWGFLMNRLEDRYQLVKGNLTKKSVKLFGGNTFDIGKDTAHTVWFPVQAKAATVMGDTRVHRKDIALISEELATEASQRSQPGDILVERRNWYVSNVGLPGFWPHAALYLGSTDELAAYFADAEVQEAFKQPFAQYLEQKHARAFAEYRALDHEQHTNRILEAMSEGVVFTSVEHSIATADYVAAVRPMRSKLDKARAIDRAFSYAGRPYDFDFDFFTDASLVCSELVYKAYEPRSDCTGVAFPLERVVGRMTLGPNTMVRQFDEEYGTDKQQLAFVWFLDGHEKAKSATFESVDVFRASHRRPKWDVVQK